VIGKVLLLDPTHNSVMIAQSNAALVRFSYIAILVIESIECRNLQLWHLSYLVGSGCMLHRFGVAAVFLWLLSTHAAHIVRHLNSTLALLRWPSVDRLSESDSQLP